MLALGTLVGAILLAERDKIPGRIAALFVLQGGPYCGLEDVDPWTGTTPERDARLYAGPLPVVAHPPCAAWGRYARPTVTSTARGPLVGDDGGCFAAALAAVRRWGGVIEHPKDSKAWAWFGIGRPTGRWQRLIDGGWTCEVEQGHYGHLARKPTWLYYYSPMGKPPLPLVWGPSEVEPRPWSPRRGVLECLSHRQRSLTPPVFRDALIVLAQNSR